MNLSNDTKGNVLSDHITSALSDSLQGPHNPILFGLGGGMSLNFKNALFYGLYMAIFHHQARGGGGGECVLFKVTIRPQFSGTVPELDLLSRL